MMSTAPVHCESVEGLITDQLGLWTTAIKRRSAAGRGSSSKVELYGIKKLRELILELAVRGLLVPQDPNDEPASELLKRIAAEKSKLVKAGKIKKEKPPVPVLEHERPFELPEGWEWARLTQLAPMSLVDGDWIETIDQDPSGGIRLIQLADIGVGQFKDKSERFINEGTFERLNCTAIEAGDILIARLPSPIGRACIFPGLSTKAITVVDVAILRPLMMYSADYLTNVINSKTTFEQVEDFGKGATRFRISTGNLKGLAIPVAPVSEQRRIVAKVDELMALCDQLEQQTDASLSAHQTLVETLLSALTSAGDHAQFASSWQRIAEHFDTLFTTEESIDQLKKTILQLAVIGKLVPQNPNDESASELLKKITAEKAKQVKEGRARKEQLLQPVNYKERPFELPKQWERVRLGEVIHLISGQHLGPDEYFDSPRPDTLPYLTGPAEFGEYYPEATRYTTERRAVATNGDILLTVKGSGVGKTNVVVQPEIAISRQLMAIRPIILDGRFVKIVMESLAETFQAKSIGIAIPGISRDDVLEAVLRLPPLMEQHRIVAKVDEMMALCNQLKLSLNAAQITQLHLADAFAEKELARG